MKSRPPQTSICCLGRIIHPFLQYLICFYFLQLIFQVGLSASKNDTCPSRTNAILTHTFERENEHIDTERGKTREPAQNSSKGVEVGINHLFSSGSRILGELHDNKPMVVITTRQHNRLPLLIAATPLRRVIAIQSGSHQKPRSRGGMEAGTRNPTH